MVAFFQAPALYGDIPTLTCDNLTHGGCLHGAQHESRPGEFVKTRGFASENLVRATLGLNGIPMV